jgi:hypothetical protein
MWILTVIVKLGLPVSIMKRISSKSGIRGKDKSTNVLSFPSDIPEEVLPLLDARLGTWPFVFLLCARSH